MGDSDRRSGRMVNPRSRNGMMITDPADAFTLGVGVLLYWFPGGTRGRSAKCDTSPSYPRFLPALL